MKQLRSPVLSLFPGIDLLGRAFESVGFPVVRGPDPALGQGDIRNFHLTGVFSGVMGGSPCQDFSKARRDPPSGEGLEMLAQFERIVLEVGPDWWLLENVPSVPELRIDGYTHQRIDLKASEFGLKQRRLRHFQFGTVGNEILVVDRGPVTHATEPCCMASEGERASRRSFADFCELQGLPRDFDIPYFTQSAKYRAVGNGVPLPMGRALALSIAFNLFEPWEVRVCACGCGRRVTGKQQSATVGCRKRLERRRA